MDYLTKWPEAFAIPEQKAKTIAPLFLEHIVCRHSIPEGLLSDRGANFLSKLIQEICKILGVKINTSGYHPQTDGLVEKFNATLMSMIAKSTSDGAECKSAKESPFSSCMGETLVFPHQLY